jgi:hypothetical protein
LSGDVVDACGVPDPWVAGGAEDAGEDAADVEVVAVAGEFADDGGGAVDGCREGGVGGAGGGVECDESFACDAVDGGEFAADDEFAGAGDLEGEDGFVEGGSEGGDPVAGVAVEGGEERLVLGGLAVSLLDAGEAAADVDGVVDFGHVPDEGVDAAGVGCDADDAPLVEGA